jgi:DNA-directed RNA polymerase specialized sigma24 family protein
VPGPMDARAQRGNVEVYRALLNDVGPEVVSCLRARVPNPQEVQDLCVEPRLCAIASHVLPCHVRRRRARMSKEVLVDSPPEWAVEESGHAGLRLAQALDRLPAKHPDAIDLVQHKGLSTAATAARARTTPGARRVRTRWADKTVREFVRR